MAKYAVTVRSARAQSVRTAVAGGTLLLCKGAAALAAPPSGNILSQHALFGTVGAVDGGAWTIPPADIGADAEANNTGTPTYILFLDAGGAPIAAYTSSEISISVTPAPGDTQIEAGRNVVIRSIKIIEGGS